MLPPAVGIGRVEAVVGVVLRAAGFADAVCALGLAVVGGDFFTTGFGFGFAVVGGGGGCVVVVVASVSITRGLPRDARVDDDRRVEKSIREPAISSTESSGVLLLRKAARLTTTKAAHISPATIFPAARRCSCRSPSFPVWSAPGGRARP